MLLGVDMGSSRCKAVVFRSDGSEAAGASYTFPPALRDGALVTQNPSVFWEGFVRVVSSAARQAAAGGEPITALAISSHGETIVPVSQQGSAVGAAIMNSDNRAAEQSARLIGLLGEGRIYEITGTPPHEMFGLCKLMWLKEHQPALYASAWRFVTVPEYLHCRLGLDPLCDESLASRFLAFDIRAKGWSDILLDAAQIPSSKLPKTAPAGTVAGVLNNVSAALLGLSPGTAVVLGGHDQPCGALGAGAVNQGEVSDSAGTYECLAVTSPAPQNTPAALRYHLNSYCHVIPGSYITLAFFPAGLVSQWYVDQFLRRDGQQADSNFYRTLDAKTASLAPGPTGLLMTPHLIGSCNPSWCSGAQGVLCGITPEVTPYHLYKAVYEGIACELALNLRALSQLGTLSDRVLIHGGNAGSPFTLALRALLTGRTFQRAGTQNAGCLGAAMLAGTATGVFTGLQAAAEQMVRRGECTAPDPAYGDYSQQLERYEALFPLVRPLFEKGGVAL